MKSFVTCYYIYIFFNSSHFLCYFLSNNYDFVKSVKLLLDSAFRLNFLS
jgi:hypothetical protein